MIYFLDNSLQLQKIVTSKNINSAVHEHELNGLIRGDIELDLSYANKFLVLGIDHVGYYYKDEFYLHKIQRVEYDHVNETATVVLRHIFFEDMIFGKLIRDVRPKNQDALTVSRQTIDANTRWQTIMTDVTGRLSTNFYWQVPYEVIEFMTENYRIEYLPKILFDGKKINGFQLHLANKIGEDKNIRIPYGSRVLDLKYEEDYSEIITKLVVHGKGEEVGDGYGRRINISDVNFSRNGVESPVGSLYLEDESITNTYGNDGQTPREGREVFEDIEDANELAEAGYQHYLQVSRPQMLFTADVADIGDVGIGDSVMIIRREYDVYFKARIHKLSVDLLYPEDAQVELGDYKHFKESKIARKTREKNNRMQGQLSDRITRLKLEANERFDNEVAQWKSEYEQALIDVHAEIEADRENMQNLLDTKSEQWTENFNQSVAESKEYAEQKAQEKAEEVRTNLENITDGHQAMLQELETNVMNIDDFIGPRDRTLQTILDEQRITLEEKIEVYNKNYPNLVVGSTLENIDGFEGFMGSDFELITNESLNYIRVHDNGATSTPSYYFPDTVFLEQGEKNTLALDFRSDVVKDLDYIYFMGLGSTPNVALDVNLTRGLVADGEWHRYYFTFTWVNTTRQARLMIGTNFSRADINRGWFDTRQVHLYKGDTHNIPWTPSPSDNAQVVSQLLYEMRQLEDGMSTLATKTEVDLLTGNVTQLTNEYHSTSEQVSSKLQNFDDVLGVNGSHFTQIAEQVQSKVWLNDVTDINPNLIPFADTESAEGMDNWFPWFASNITSRWVDDLGEYVVRSTGSGENLAIYTQPFNVTKDEELVLSFIGRTSVDWNSSPDFRYSYLINDGGTNQFLGSPEIEVIDSSRQRYTWYFNASFTGQARVMLGTYRLTKNADARFGFKEPKLERGSERTPFLNAFSNIEQLANKIALQVQELDGEYLSQSDLQITPNYWQLGATRIGADNVSSVLRGSPDALDAVVSNFNLTGNLNAKGQITSLAVDAIEGNFARLFANQLTANVITSDHIQVGTALVDKMFATSVRIDELITKTHFVNEMHALTLNVVDLNASEIRARLLTANTIEAEWIKSGTALLDRVFSSTAMFERMMAKSGFVTTLNTVTIDTDQITIRRPDGGALISQGMQMFGSPIITKPFPSQSVNYDFVNYTTNMSGAQTFERAYGEHSGRWANFSFSVSLRYDSQHASSLVGIAIRLGTSPSGVYIPELYTEEVMAYRDSGSRSYTVSVRLPVPTYGGISWTLEFYRIGGVSGNYVQIRSNRCWISS